jgi:hypothetical protein
LVADSPLEMANAIARLYSDEILWGHISVNGYDNVRRHFSRAAARTVLKSLLA